jgi:hypothetical protein
MLTSSLLKSSLLPGLALVAVSTLAGCGLLSKKKTESSSEPVAATEAPAEPKKSAGDKSANAAAPETKPASVPAAEGPTWTEEITGEKKKMARVDLTADVAGLSILAPEGAKVAASPGGHGAEIEDSAYGYLVWVHEDPTATIELMKQGATAWAKDTKFIKEEKTSLILSQPSVDGSPAYYYKGIYKSGAKVIVCETPTSIAPSKQSHAEQIAKACDSLQAAGTSLVAGAEPAAADPAASASVEVAANDPPPAAPAGQPQAPQPQANGNSQKAYADQQNAALTSALGGTPPPPKSTATPPATAKPAPAATALRRPTLKK